MYSSSTYLIYVERLKTSAKEPKIQESEFLYKSFAVSFILFYITQVANAEPELIEHKASIYIILNMMPLVKNMHQKN